MAVYSDHRVIRRIAFVALGVAVVLLATICVALIPSRRPQLTAGDFQKVQIGTTRKELHELLGSPDFEKILLGKVTSPTTITVNFSTGEDKKRLMRSGYSDHIMDCWFSPAITIQAFVDASGQVVCRNASGGQRISTQQKLMRSIWPPRRVTLTLEE